MRFMSLPYRRLQAGACIPVETTKLVCGACGKSFLYKPEYAGKAFKCKCGSIIRAPAAQPAAAGSQARPMHPKAPVHAPVRPVSARPKPTASANPAPAPAIAQDADPFAALVAQAEEYEVSNPPPVRASARVAVAKVTSTAAVAKPTSPMLAYASQRRAPTQDVEEARVKNIFVPLALLVAGIIAYVIDASLHGLNNPVFIMVFVAFHVIVNLVLVFVALMIGVKLLNLGLGEVGPALLKIAAVALLPGAIGSIIAFKLFGYVSWGVTVLMYWGLMAYLFELDMQEMWIITAIIWVIQTWVGFILIGIMLSMIGAGGPGPLGAGPGPSPTSGSRLTGGPPIAFPLGVASGSRADQSAAAMVRNGIPDAREFLSPSNPKNQSVRPKEQVLAMVNDLYTAGATHVWIAATETADDVTNASALLLEMPRKIDARKAVLKVVDEFNNATDASGDDNDRYLMVPLE